MELEQINLELKEQELNVLISKLNKLYKNQQVDFASLCYSIYKIDCWFNDHPDEVVFSTNYDYYDRKKLFKTLGFKNKQINRCIKCYSRYMTLSNNSPKIKETYSSFTSSKLIELLSISIDELDNLIAEGKILPTMTVKELREFIKTFDEEDIISEDEDTRLPEDNKYLILNNDTMRQDFIDNYKTWGLWFEEPLLGLKYYRCKVNDETIVATFGKTKTTDFVSYFTFNSANSLCIFNALSNSELIAKMNSAPDNKVYLF